MKDLALFSALKSCAKQKISSPCNAELNLACLKTSRGFFSFSIPFTPKARHVIIFNQTTSRVLCHSIQLAKDSSSMMRHLGPFYLDPKVDAKQGTDYSSAGVCSCDIWTERSEFSVLLEVCARPTSSLDHVSAPSLVVEHQEAASSNEALLVSTLTVWWGMAVVLISGLAGARRATKQAARKDGKDIMLGEIRRVYANGAVSVDLDSEECNPAKALGRQHFSGNGTKGPCESGSGKHDAIFAAFDAEPHLRAFVFSPSGTTEGLPGRH